MVITVLDKPATEDTLLRPCQPLCRNKLMGERMITGWPIAVIGRGYFRYFNVAGAEMDV